MEPKDLSLKSKPRNSSFAQQKFEQQFSFIKKEQSVKQHSEPRDVTNLSRPSFKQPQQQQQQQQTMVDGRRSSAFVPVGPSAFMTTASNFFLPSTTTTAAAAAAAHLLPGGLYADRLTSQQQLECLSGLASLSAHHMLGNNEFSAHHALTTTTTTPRGFSQVNNSSISQQSNKNKHIRVRKLN